jgi:hypothetical protein
MSEAEKQEGQKTVVAFITGLLIGGLLVWVFSSTPENTVMAPSDESTTSETSDAPSDNETTVVSAVKSTDAPVNTPVIGDGSLTVGDQSAGDVVTLTNVAYPAKTGWIVVRDYSNGLAGNILGAARYNLDEGLTPKSVSLLRKTMKDSSYQVGFFTESGDKAFSLSDDIPVRGGEAVFKAN